MSKSDLPPELLQGQLSAVADPMSTTISSEVLSKTNHETDSVAPFAKDMIETVVTGALSILDVSRKEGKPWNEVLSTNKSPSDLLSSQDTRSVDEASAESFLQKNLTCDSFASADTQRPEVQVMHLQIRDDVVCDSVHAEQVAKIVKGLQDIQIGDSAYVLPADGSNIENQVKRAVRHINSLEFGDTVAAQLIICDGQGDVDAAILEAGVGPPSNANFKPQHDAAKISTCFLHKMIEELEDSDSTKGNLAEHGNKEGIATWEESEEKFVRIIEGPGDERGHPLSEYPEYRHPPMIFYQQSEAQAAENVAANRNFKNSSGTLGQSQQAFSKEGVIDDRENCGGARDRLDNYTDEEPYWCTAGLITTGVTPEQGKVFLSRPMMDEKESGISGLGVNLEVIKTENSIREFLSTSEQAEEKPEADKDEESRLKGKKKSSFGKRLRKFLTFKRNRDC